VPASPGIMTRNAAVKRPKHGDPTSATEQVLAALQVLRLNQPPGQPPQLPVAVAPTDFVPDRVPDDRPGRAQNEHQPQRDLALLGQHPTQQHRDLTGKDETDESRRLQGRNQEH